MRSVADRDVVDVTEVLRFRTDDGSAEELPHPHRSTNPVLRRTTRNQTCRSAAGSSPIRRHGHCSSDAAQLGGSGRSGTTASAAPRTAPRRRSPHRSPHTARTYPSGSPSKRSRYPPGHDRRRPRPARPPGRERCRQSCTPRHVARAPSWPSSSAARPGKPARVRAPRAVEADTERARYATRPSRVRRASGPPLHASSTSRSSGTTGLHAQATIGVGMRTGARGSAVRMPSPAHRAPPTLPAPGPGGRGGHRPTRAIRSCRLPATSCNLLRSITRGIPSRPSTRSCRRHSHCRGSADRVPATLRGNAPVRGVRARQSGSTTRVLRPASTRPWIDRSPRDRERWQ
ncbi:hypothetical protein FHX44_118140 [Pseudonocardia hierapolitana]|uniref:Uncharacterized protein n=1 Tax=Pseudonocardia hierapolitana TaxID=1128676 RepID=A0A561T513_9PSEU|nr:hypothetical protein FHX44_118140 [Pseudonocardia hierapolitana]